jgi:hypothetical protein
MRPFLALLWLAALLLRPAAQGDGLTLSARAGFDSLFKESAAVPIVVSARNDGPPIEGEIRVAVDSSDGGEIVYTAPISLPTGSDKRVMLYVHVLPFAGDLTMQLVSDETVLATVNTNQLTMTPADDLLYGVVTADPGGLAFLETVTGGRSGADVAFLDLADLPDVSIAWRALDVLVLDDVDTSRLTAGQLTALRAWIENGGQLVVTGGPGGPKTAAAVADLLPVTVGGVESVDDLPALSAFGGAPFVAPGPYTLTGSSLRAGELLIHQDGLPLLAHTSLGRGGITFLALDPKLAPLAGWSGQSVVWEQIAALSPARGPWSNGIQDGYAATQAIGSIPGLRLPSIWQLLLFLFAYTLVTGPINFLVLRRLRRRELAWVTIPVLVLLFSAITFFTGFRTRGGAAVLNEMSIAYGSIDAERVRAQSVVGLYSPRRGRYDLSLPYDTTAVPFGAGFGAVAGGGNVAAIARAGDLTLRDVRADTGEVVTFLIDAHRPRPPLSATAQLVDDGRAVAVTVRNEGETPLENAVIVYGDQQQQLGDVAAGETRETRLPLSASALPGATPTPDPLVPVGVILPNPLINDPTFILGTADYFNDPQAYPRWQLLQSLYTYSESGPLPVADPTEAVTLAGWLPSGGQPIDTGDAATTRETVTLVLLEVPVR